MDTESPGAVSERTARGRMRRLNITTQLAVIVPVGTLLIAFDSSTWWEAAVLVAGVLVAMVAVVRWAQDDLLAIALPCLGSSAAVWVFGVLVGGSATAFYSLTIVGPLVVPQLPRYRIPAAVALTAFVAAVGATRLLVSRGSTGGVLFQYALVPTAVAVCTLGFMFANQAFYRLMAELEEAREQEAELAVARERIRFASELHDIQGHTLHVVKLKTALAERLVRVDAGRAEQELREVHALVGDTIKQTKELAYAQRRLNLAGELENAKNLFEAAGIRVRIVREAQVDGRAGELLGQVLRETTTNILRHAQAAQVRITLSEFGITIVNDGAHDGGPPELRGLSTLRERLAGEGGELTVTRHDGEFVTAAAFRSAVAR
ncbi:two-component system sensor histidine kinase DesK [Umezawaea tangerina]|uniref:Two-component system sensor histidine kinase DesK n=2 Tax=Umezawaea tangerina TaxID=84725 RepID=A0A2T0T708_9PSEU|nr:two-component system sensor histidine kinase DesK [Umezawaea tangerina]